MSTTQLFILLTIVGLVFVIIIALVGLIIWRRRRNQQAKAEVVERQLGRLAAQPNGTEEIAPGLPSAAKPSPLPAANKPPMPAPLPISALNHPEEEGEPIRILVVDDNPGTRDNVSRLLYFEKDMEVIGQAVNGRQGIEMAERLKPHIVLMDINMPDMDGITATNHMSVKTPYSQVIIMSVQSEQHYMKQAMAAGARDFQPKPFTAEELVGCIRRVYQIGLPIYRQLEALENAGPQQMTPAQQKKAAQEQKGAPVIAVYSAKGGIGTSTLAVNLAIALQQTHREIALVDADLQFGDISVHLNTRPERTIIDAIQAGSLDIELIPEVMLPHNSGLKLLLAPTQPEMADEITADMIPKIIKELKNHFKVVIIDTASQLTDKTLSVLDNADYILLVTTPELPAIKSTKLFLELGQQLEWDLSRIQVIMNRANLPGGIPAANIEKALKISTTFPIPYDPRIHAAINKGVAVTQQDSGAPSAKAITQLAAMLWHKMSEADAIPELTEMA